MLPWLRIVWSGAKDDPLIAIFGVIAPILVGTTAALAGNWAATFMAGALAIMSVIFLGTWAERQLAYMMQHLTECPDCRARFIADTAARAGRKARMN